jgi:hypothetical protein
MEMTFKTATNAAIGLPTFDINSVDVVAKVPVGTIARAYDDTQGDAEFIYLPGAAGIVAGDLAVYDLLPAGQTTVRSLAATHVNTGQPCAVAIAAVGAGQFGWFQISGVAIVNVTAASAAGKAFLTATASQLNSAAVAGVQVCGARLSSAINVPSANKSYLTLNRPFIQGQIT